MKEKQSSARPIFIHAIWRTGSTYIWKKFRDQDRYRSYFEPLNELLLRSQEEIESLQPTAITVQNRHPHVDRFYYAEFPFKTQGGVEYFEKHFPYERYCLDESASDEPLRKYVSHLISLAQNNGQIPVLQFNRSLLRVGWLNRNFAPLNVLLLRRPMDIWQSYLYFYRLYFPTVVSLILGQNRHNYPLREIAEFQTVPFYVNDSFEKEFEYYHRFTRRSLKVLYPLFYSFYVLTCAYAARYADCIIDMNEVSGNPQVRDALTRKLYDLGVEISLSDCNLPRYTALSRSDQEWLAYECVARRLLRARLPSSLLLPAGKLQEHEPLLSDYFRGVLSEFTLLAESKDRMSNTSAALSSDEKHRQGRRLCEQGRYHEASGLLDEALGGQETAERWNDWAVVQIALGHWENAERGFRRALKLDPSFAVATANLGVLPLPREIQCGREIVRLVRQRIPVAGRRVLDVGCGYGGTLIAFAEQGAHVVGVESSEERARIGRKRLLDLDIQVDYRLDDICKPGVELRLGTFDIIVAQDVLEHVLDLHQAIRSLSCLLRPGGVIYAQAGNKYAPGQLLADHHYGRTGISN